MASIPKAEVAKTTPAAPAESVYSVAELIANFHLFSANRDIVVLALRKAGKESATFAEAKAIIDKFKTKEVK